MADQSLTPPAPVPPAGTSRLRVLWPLAAVAIVAIAGAGAGAYFGLRGATGPGSGPESGPPARAFAAAAYDDESHQVVLFGGMGADGTALGDTWTWDGSTWTQQHPQSSPPARAYAAMAYDPKAHGVVLVGGRTLSKFPPTVCSGSINAGGPNATPGVARPPSTPCATTAPAAQVLDTWLWDGGTWHRKEQEPNALAGQTPVVGTDPTTGQVLMLAMAFPSTPALMCPAPVPPQGGGSPVPQPAIACPAMPQPKVLTWSWNGTGWAELQVAPPQVAPPVASSAMADIGPGALASDPASGHLIDVHAGAAVRCVVTPAAGVPAPCPVYTSGAVPASPGAPISPAGTGSASGPGVTLATPPAQGPGAPVPMPTGVPGPPSVDCCGGSLSTWTGSEWKDVTTFSNGPGVVASMLAGDPAQHELVAYTPLGTWTWNGSAWKQQHPPAAPPPVQGASLVYDGASGKLLLFGGEALSMNRSSSQALQMRAIPVSDELWAWDGSTWTQLTGAKDTPAPSPAATPTPTFVSPATPRASPSPPGRPSPLPSPSTALCTPVPTPTPAPVKPSGTSTAPNAGCVGAVPSAAAVASG